MDEKQGRKEAMKNLDEKDFFFISFFSRFI